MPVSRGNILIAGVGVALVLILIGVIAIIVISSEGPVTSGIFKRCDGLPYRIEKINISSCPNSADDGYCRIDSNSDTKLEVNFTPARDIKFEVLYDVSGPTSQLSGSDVCDIAACPLKAGKKNKATLTLNPIFFQQDTSGQVKFEIYVVSDEKKKEEIYCIEFPVKVI